MYKLKVIAGPLRGNSYDIRDGETTVGRSPDNGVILNTTKVSKKHCLILIEGGQITVKDTGSSNGTFVNGMLATAKKVSPGDRISVGEHVLEVSKTLVAKKPTGHLSVVSTSIPMPQPMGGTSPSLGMGIGVGTGVGAAPSVNSAMQAPPKDYIEKIKFYFEKYVINFLYTLNEKYEWNVLLRALIAVLVVFSAAVSVFPMADKTQDILLVEARNRARAMARLIVDHNQQNFLKRNEVDLDVTFAEKEDGVIAAYIIDMEGRVLAPGKKLNQTITEGQQGRFIENARRYFQKNERYFSMPLWNSDGSINATYPMLDGEMMGMAEPIKILDAAKGQNVVVGMAVVFLDSTRFLVDFEATLLMFATALIFSAIMAVAVYTAVYKITVRPIEKIAEGVDRALSGEQANIMLDFKIEECDPLVNVVNTALSRVSGGGGGMTNNSTSSDNADDFLNPAKFFASRAESAAMVITGDKKVVFINTKFEEITGIRNDGSMGQDMSAVCRDEAFSLMLLDVTSRAPLGAAEGASDTIEFSGVNYTIECVGIGSMGGISKGYIVTLKLQS